MRSRSRAIGSSLEDVKKWLKLSDKQVRNSYYTNKVAETTGETEYALVAFHFSTKQIKQWVWADFEHPKNPGRCDYIGCHDSFGAADANVAPKKPNEQQYGEMQEKARRIRDVYQRGHQQGVGELLPQGVSDFVRKGRQGRPARKLRDRSHQCRRADRKIIIHKTCHQYASFKGDGGANFKALDLSPVGKVDPDLLKGYVTNDFLWGSITM